MADFELYKDAILTTDLPDDGLRAGDVGTVVERHKVDGVGGDRLQRRVL